MPPPASHLLIAVRRSIGRRRIAWRPAALALLLAAGLWSSLHRALWLWPADPDLATPWLVWHQLVQDGPHVLLRWRFAQDNWLLSLILPDLAIFSLLGGAPAVLLVQGWAVLVAVCGLVFLLLRRVAGSQAALIAATLPLLADPAALGRIGFLSYAVSHETSMLWGLAALAAAGAYIRRPAAARLAAMLVFQVVGAMSDPWLSAALVLPTVLAALLAMTTRPARARLGGVAAVTALGMVLVRGRLLVLHALPGPDFALGPPALWASHLAWTLRQAAALLQVIPLPMPQPDPLWLPSLPLAMLDLLPVALALLWAGPRLWSGRARLPPEQRLIALTALLSAAATPAAFVLSAIPPEPGSGRYVGNLAAVLPLLLGCAWAAGPRPGQGPRLAIGAWAALFVLAGVVVMPWQLVRGPASLARPWDLALAEFLEAHDLHQGYGGFWGSHASAITWLTRGRVTLRAVEASPAPGSGAAGPPHVEPRLPQSFPSWFPAAGPPDPAADTPSFFVAQPSDELCPTLPDCLALALHSFGPADETLRLGPLPILVWNHLVLDHPVAASVAAAPILAPGRTVTFGAGGDGAALLWQGWSPPEPSITWTQATRAVLLLHLPQDWSGDAVLEVEASAYPRRDATAQPVSVIAHDAVAPADRGTTLATWTVIPYRRTRYRAVLPWSIARSRLVWLQLDIPGADLPSRTGGGFDPRALGLSLRSLTLQPLLQPIP